MPMSLKVRYVQLTGAGKHRCANRTLGESERWDVGLLLHPNGSEGIFRDRYSFSGPRLGSCGLSQLSDRHAEFAGEGARLFVELAVGRIIFEAISRVELIAAGRKPFAQDSLPSAG